MPLPFQPSRCARCVQGVVVAEVVSLFVWQAVVGVMAMSLMDGRMAFVVCIVCGLLGCG